jgi:hypothetical protein
MPERPDDEEEEGDEGRFKEEKKEKKKGKKDGKTVYHCNGKPEKNSNKNQYTCIHAS